MNKWILVYDDGRTPAILTTEVQAQMMVDARAASGLPPSGSANPRHDER
jgi:hypothetical protein